MVKYSTAAAAAMLVTVLLPGCGGDSGTSSSVSPPPPPPGSTTLNGNGGLWTGTVSAPGTAYDGYDVIGVYTKSGESKFWFYRDSDGHGGPGFMVSPGEMTPMDDTDFSGSYQGYGNNVTLPNGTSLETGTVDVSVDTSDGSLSGSIQSDDPGAAQDNASFTGLVYDQTTYTSGSSQSTLLINSGNYGFQFNLPGTGTVNGTMTFSASTDDSVTDTITGMDTLFCSYSGTAVVINKKYDAYDVTLNRTCLGTTTTLTGIGVFYPAGVIAVNNIFGMLLDDGASLGVEIVAQPSS